VGGKTVESVRDLGERSPGIAHPDDGYSRYGIQWLFDNNTMGATVNGLIDKVMSVTLGAPDSHKKTSPRDMSTVVVNLAHLTVKVTVSLQNGKILNQVFQQQYCLPNLLPGSDYRNEPC
jgi:hypothetical protein